MLAGKIATRFLFSNKSQMVLIMLGVAIGVAVQIFIGSLIFGLQASLIDNTVGSSPHIIIRNKDRNKTVENYQDIDLNNDQITNASPSLDTNLFINVNDTNTPVLLRATNFDKSNKIYKFSDKLVEGRMPSKDNEIIIGKTILKDQKLKINDEITMFSPTQKLENMKIVGSFDLGIESLNTLWAIGNLDYIQKQLDEKNQVSVVEIQIKDVFAADDIAKTIKTDYQVTTWKQQNQQLLTGLSGQSSSSYMIQFFVIVSVVLGISSVLIITVVQKRREIGILKAMGIKNSTASLIFILQGLIFGIIGGILGVSLGVGLLYAFATFVTNPDGTPVVPVSLDATFIALSFVIALVASTLSSIIPSLKSSKLNPVEVINNG